ncbi:MAG: HD domain-containing protein, partial [Bacteroidota bacterium]
MGEFLNNLSVAEAIGDLYGKAVRILTAISSIATSIGGIAIQFQIIGKMLTLLLGFQGPEVTMAAAAIVILYSAFGGIRSVTLTDVFQFITFSIFIPILALIVWNNLRDPGQVVLTLTTNPIFSLREVGWNPQFMSSLGLLICFAIPGLAPSLFQRVAMARDLKQVRSSFTYATGIDLLMLMAVTWIAILLLADNPSLEPGKLVSYIIEHYAYPGLKGFIALGITAMSMSTADSELNTSAVLAVHDIIKPLKPSFEEPIFIVRIFSFCLGSIALLLALHTTDLLELILLSGSFYMPFVSVPLLLAIFGFRSSAKAVLIGMAAGCIAVVSWGRYFAYTGINNIIPGMVASLAFLMGSHYLFGEKGGWIGIKEPGPLLAARQARRDTWKALIRAIKHPRPYAYLKKNLPTKEGLFSLFGLYVIGATYASFFTIPEPIVTAYQKLYDHIAHSVLIASAAFITYPAWPPTFKSKRFIAFAWPLGIGYILFVVGGVLVFMSGFHQVQVMIFMLNLVMAALLLYWPLMLLLLTSGLLLALGAFKLYAGSVPLLGVSDALQFRVIYGIPLFISFLVALVRFKQAKIRIEHKHEGLISSHEETTKQLIKALQHEERFVKALNEEGIEELTHIAKVSQQLEEQAKALDLSLSPSFTQTLRSLRDRVEPAMSYLQILAHRTTAYLRLEVANTSLDTLLQEALAMLKVQAIASIPQVIIQSHSRSQNVECDVAKIKQLIVNAILYAQKKHTNHQPILLGIEDTTLGYPINSVKDYIKKVAALQITITTADELPHSDALYLGKVDQPSLWIPQAKEELSLSNNQHIVAAHYGYISLNIIAGSITQIYVIPISIREVRPKTMDIPEMEVGVEHLGSDESYPGAAEQETGLLEAISSRTTADLAVVHKAIRLIKQYHGPVKRKSGEPFYLHPIAVAQIVLDYTQDEDAIISALLHDLVEDTEVSLAQIGLMFNPTVQRIVDGVTHLASNLKTLYKVKLSAHENIQQLLEGDDDRVLYVKLADRMHNMRTIQGHSSLTKQKHIAEETLQFFVPIASHLGLTQVVKELKKLCLAVLNQ